MSVNSVNNVNNSTAAYQTTAAQQNTQAADKTNTSNTAAADKGVDTLEYKKATPLSRQITAFIPKTKLFHV